MSRGRDPLEARKRGFPETLGVEPDPLLSLLEQCRADTRLGKCDLGIGVYCDENGRTPVFSAVRAAQQRLAERQDTKSYLGLRGNATYLAALRELVFGADLAGARMVSVQTPGGSSALSLASIISTTVFPGATVWTSVPDWSNYDPLLIRGALKHRQYPYQRWHGGGLDLQMMLEGLGAAHPGDIVVLQANCHNPTGIDPQPEDWWEIACFLDQNGLIPLIDLAYQGMSHAPDMDAVAARVVVSKVGQGFVAVTNSKNFGLYRERTGALFVQAETGRAAQAVQGLIFDILKRLHAMPPDHGAAIVAEVLGDATLRAEWVAELERMRNRLSTLRRRFGEALALRTKNEIHQRFAADFGLFTLLPMGKECVTQLREEQALYLAPDGRINLSGLGESTIDHVVAILAPHLIGSKDAAALATAGAPC